VYTRRLKRGKEMEEKYSYLHCAVKATMCLINAPHTVS
jgi:hypothetical protein